MAQNDNKPHHQWDCLYHHTQNQHSPQAHQTTLAQSVASIPLNAECRLSYLGRDLLLMGQAEDDKQIYHQKLEAFGQLQRDVMNYLLDYKPLHSRKLWQQSLLYQQSS